MVTGEELASSPNIPSLGVRTVILLSARNEGSVMVDISETRRQKMSGVVSLPTFPALPLAQAPLSAL